jgi:hypothetical protein
MHRFQEEEERLPDEVYRALGYLAHNAHVFPGHGRRTYHSSLHDGLARAVERGFATVEGRRYGVTRRGLRAFERAAAARTIR